MATYAKMKGKAVSPTQGRSRNQPEVLQVQQKGKAVAPTQGRTRNRPATAPIPKTNIGKGIAHTFYANSRTPVHPKFDTKRKHD
jgi:hypothetical protein